MSHIDHCDNVTHGAFHLPPVTGRLKLNCQTSVQCKTINMA